MNSYLIRQAIQGLEDFEDMEDGEVNRDEELGHDEELDIYLMRQAD